LKPSPFAYHRPASVEEALDLLATLDDAKVLAGGQSLVPLMNFRLAAPAHLVDISRLAELDFVDVGDDAVNVGAAVTHARLHAHDGVASACPLLREALGLVAHEVIRNRGTVCGSLAHADPSGELTAVMALLGGTVEARSVRGARRLDAAELFQGPLMNGLTDDELVVSASFPTIGPRTGTAFDEVVRRHGDYAIAGGAARVAVDDDGVVTDAAVAFISVGPVPVVLDLAEPVAGRTAAAVDPAAVYDHVVERVEPREDIHATAEYRRHLAGATAARAIACAAERAAA
jgi:carbon-monoxide dehydrogenase medium subunit